jgi:trk system potassium uptake protein TrkA
MSALVEEAVSVGDLVRLFTFRQGEANLVELTLPEDSPIVGTAIADVAWPVDTTLVSIIRGKHVLAPLPDLPLEAGDELIFVTTAEHEGPLEVLLSPHAHPAAG